MTGAMAEANPPPRRFGHFEIIERLGSGGFGTVWKAREVSLGLIVAVKMLSVDLADDTHAYIARKQARIDAHLERIQARVDDWIAGRQGRVTPRVGPTEP